MLAKDQLRFRIEGGRIEPRLLRPTPAALRLCTELLAFWREGVGQQRGPLEEAVVPVLHGSRSLLLARGLEKLVLDACAFREPPSLETERGLLLAASARLLAQPAADPAAHRVAVAAAAGLPDAGLEERLYADHPEAAVLESAPAWTAEELVGRYNLALCQGLLLGARSLRVRINDADTCMRRRLLAAMRFQRLLAEVHADGPELRLELGGPASVLDQGTRYGLRFACFLPALACCQDWRAEAEIEQGQGGARRRLRLELSPALGLPGDSAYLGFVPSEIAGLRERLAERLPGWRIEDGRLLPLPDGELVVADLRLQREDGRHADLELFHRWHAQPLHRRLGQMAAGALPLLVLGVDRSLAKRQEFAGLAEDAVMLRQGFLFSEIPAPGPLAAAVERLIGG